MTLARSLSRRDFDAAVLLPNSFRSGLLVTMAGVPRRIGYDRDGRGFMLTDRLIPRRAADGTFLPVPARDYYLGIARYLGAERVDPHLELFTRAEDDAAADELLRAAGFDPSSERRLVLLNPGAQREDKRWPAERFAALADALAQRGDASVAVTGSPAERPLLDRVIDAADTPVLDLPAHGLTLKLLKSVMRRAALLVTNDTGPRHVAAAMGTPVVTLFGPTLPQWTTIDFEHERELVAPGLCERCRTQPQRKADRCTHTLELATVRSAAEQLLAGNVSRRNPCTNMT